MQSGTDFASAPHVVGEARNYIGPAPGKLDLPAIARRCNVREEAPLGGFLAQDFVEFGGRWANIRRMRYGASEALLELELPRAYRADVQGYGLHPALLDMATGGAQALIPGVDLQQDFYVPLSYERIVVFADMPAHVFSHVRCLPESGNGLAFFDVTLSTAEGEVFAELSRFAMKRLDADSAMTAPASVTPSPADTRRSEAMAALLREAILPREGLEAFDRIMAQPNLGQAFVSSVDLIAWQTQLDAVALEHLAGAAETKPAGFLRPELASAFEAPTEPVELALAEVWSELLGVSELGVHDDFFELGGNSLVAVRLFAAIKKRFRVSLPLSALFEAPTIRQLAAVIGNSPLADVSASATPERRLSSEPPRSNAPIALELPGKYTPLVSIQQGTGRPFFCVHGAGGNVLNFQALAKRLGEDQTFYGLQAKGVEGGDTARSIEEMAAAYIDSIRRVQRHGPYLLGGYSGGGVVAYEMAQRLRAAGEEVILAFLDTFHPATKESAPTLQERFEHLLAEGPSYLARTGRQRLKRLSYAANYELRTRYYQKRGMLLPVELRDPHVSIAFERAAAAYVPKRYDGPVMLFRARTIDPKFAHIGPTLGWGELIPKLEIIEVPGDHHSLMVEPNVQFLISHLKALIATAARPSEPNYSAEKVPRRTDVRL
jgi:thioesterase domain-containing protein/acyl carrier protein